MVWIAGPKNRQVAQLPIAWLGGDRARCEDILKKVMTELCKPGEDCSGKLLLLVIVFLSPTPICRFAGGWFSWVFVSAPDPGQDRSGNAIRDEIMLQEGMQRRGVFKRPAKDGVLVSCLASCKSVPSLGFVSRPRGRAFLFRGVVARTRRSRRRRSRAKRISTRRARSPRAARPTRR